MISALPNQAPAAGDPAASLALPWVVRLRYGMAAGEIVVVLGMYYGLRLEFPLQWALMPLAVVLVSNVVLSRIRALPVRFTQATLGAIFCLDTICLTAMLGFTGGATNPFSLLYLVQITLSAVVLQKIWTWILGALSTAGFGLLFFVHLSPVTFAHHSEEGLTPHLIGMWIAFVVAAALITFFTGKISDALRKREQDVLMLQEQVAKNERLASLVTLAAGAAHELGTPVGTIAIVAKELEHYANNVAGDSTVLGDSRLIRSEVDRCRKILERMSAQSAEPMGEAPRRILVRELLDQVAEQLPEARRMLLEIEVSAGELNAVLPVAATVQSLLALVQNALDASSDNMSVIISATKHDSSLVFAVHDQGYGMAPNVLRRIAEPFFTTKEPGQGMGLGTFLVRTFAESLGGRVVFDSTPGKGTTARLELPLNSPGETHAAV